MRRRPIPLIIVASLIAPALLGGCSVIGSASPGPAPSRTSTAATQSTPSAAELPQDLSFEAGAALDDSVAAQWADPLIADPDFVLTTPDDGNGTWAYTRVASQCQAQFWQGTIDDIQTDQPDEAISDDMLAAWYQRPVSDVSRYAEDSAVGFQVSGTGRVAVRAIGGDAADGGSYVTAARGFGAIPAGLIVDIRCPAGADARAEYADLRQELAIVVADLGAE